jgi:hypothetical protein
MRWQRSRRTSTPSGGAVSHTFPPQQPGRHGWAELLRLVDQVRAVAFDRSLSDGDVARRVRDLLREHDDEIETQ